MHARSLTEELMRMGWKVDLVTLDSLPIPLRFIPHVVARVVNTFCLPLGFLLKGKITGWLYEKLKRSDHDLIVFEDIYLAWNSDVPSVSILHAVWSDNLQAFSVKTERLRDLLSREVEILTRIRHPVITVSEPYKEFLINTHFCGFDIGSLEVVPQGLDQSAFNHRNNSSASMANSLVYVGALEPRKNISLLVDVFARLSTEGDQYSLTIIGDGPQFQAVVGEAKERSLKIQFLGKLDHANVVAELHKHSIYVHTSTKESFSFSLLEAKLAGLTTVAFRGLQVPPEFIDIAVDSFEPEDWVNAIRCRQGESQFFDPSAFTLERMTQDTLKIAFPSGSRSRPD